MLEKQVIILNEGKENSRNVKNKNATNEIYNHSKQKNKHKLLEKMQFSLTEKLITWDGK